MRFVGRQKKKTGADGRAPRVASDVGSSCLQSPKLRIAQYIILAEQHNLTLICRWKQIRRWRIQFGIWDVSRLV